MGSLIFISHPEVLVDAHVPVTRWGLSEKGRARAHGFARSDVVAEVKAIWSSEETKAVQTAEILSERLKVPVRTDARLGENDRSATGFLEPSVFEAAADAFFARPEASYEGWERAVDAQKRIHQVTLDVAETHGQGDLALVSHGAVGTLLYCALNGIPISREYDQPGQGHYWRAGLSSLLPRHAWTPLA